MKSNDYRKPLVLTVSLFFLWGLSYGLLDVLNKHFQEVLHLSKRESSFLQLSYFGAYFVMAIPAGRLMSRSGYANGVLVGLLLFALGALAFFPAAEMGGFIPFLVALFILASGLAFLETAANPMMTVMGTSDSGAFRLNLAQSFNGVGSILGPLVGLAFLGKTQQEGMDALLQVYLLIAAVVLAVALLVRRTRFPEPSEESDKITGGKAFSLLRHDRKFRFAVLAQGCYVAAQVGVAAFFINFVTESLQGFTDQQAASFLSGSMLLFTLGRFTGTFLLRVTDSGTLLASYAVINILLCATCVFATGEIVLPALMAVFFFESIMFPTIFAMGVRDLGPVRKAGSSVLVMSIVGGALVPFIMGVIADAFSTKVSYLVPLLCFCVVAAFGLSFRKKTSA